MPSARHFQKFAHRAIRRFLVLLGGLLLIVTLTPVVLWGTLPLITRWSEGDGDLLIVLAGSLLGQAPDGQALLGESSYLRAVYGVHVWHTHRHRQILLVGGNGAAEAMRHLLLTYGVPGEQIFLETKSTSTHENAEAASAWIRSRPEAPRKIVLLTSDFHTLRAESCFRQAGIAVHPLPCPDLLKRGQTYRERWSCLWQLADEYMRLLYYRYQGWIAF